MNWTLSRVIGRRRVVEREESARQNLNAERASRTLPSVKNQPVPGGSGSSNRTARTL